MPISENTTRYIRRIPTPVLSGNAPDVAELAVDATTDTLVFQSGGTKVAVDLSNTQTITGTKTFTAATVTTLTAPTIAGTTAATGGWTFSGATAGLRRSISVTDADTIAITEAMSGTTFIATKASGTQVFTLPAAATAGLTYSFVCGAGAAGGEVHIGVSTGDAIVAKTHAANDGTGLITTTTTGLLKQTAGANVVGDTITLVSDGLLSWYALAQTGVVSAT